MFSLSFVFAFLDDVALGDLWLSSWLGLGVLVVLCFGFIIEVSVDYFSSRGEFLEWGDGSGALCFDCSFLSLGKLVLSFV